MKSVAPQAKAPAGKPVVAQVQANKPQALKSAPIKTQVGKPAGKAPDKAKGKPDPHKPQTA
jgi:hypothetical protein